jgi:hypothetical protein
MLWLLIAILTAFVCCSTKEDFVVMMQGQCDSTQCLGKAPSQIITTHISATQGVDSEVTTKIGNYALLNLTITQTSSSAFSSTGYIDFGTHLNRNHSIALTSLADGTQNTLPDGSVQSVIAYGISGGAGRYENAQGFCSNVGLVESDQLTYYGDFACMIFVVA